MHLNLSLTQHIEIGAVRVDGQDSLEVVTTDGGQEVRNLRAADEARRWEVALPTCDIDNDRADFDSARLMWRSSERGLHSFNFHCFIDEEDVRVRFDSPLQVTAPAGHLRHIDTFTLKEVLETSPDVTIAPAITGTLTVGSTLTVSNGTWTDSPTSYVRQWTRDGVHISGATGSTYVLTGDDVGALIGCEVIATNADGSTWTAAAEVGPVL